MKIQYASDLHIEFEQNSRLLRNKPLKPHGDVLILAGDIALFKNMQNYGDFFSYLSDNFPITYWVPGNHEYYHFNDEGRLDMCNEKIRENVILANNATFVHDDVQFIFSTLWTQINPENRYKIKCSMNDYHLIEYKKEDFTPEMSNELHKKSIDFIKRTLEESVTFKRVIATHHVPTFYHYPEQYKESKINQAFAVELYGTIIDNKIDAWIFGHHHVNMPEFKIGNTRMLTNQLGYVQQDEHLLFERDRFFEV